jgi:hypothetical protein
MRGNKMNNIATKKSWKTIRFNKPKYVEVCIAISNEQFETIKYGLIPTGMDDRWFIYYARDFIHFYRSWTGHEIYKAKIQKSLDGYIINGFKVETNQNKYDCDSDEEESTRFIGIFENVLFPFHSQVLDSREKCILEIIK